MVGESDDDERHRPRHKDQASMIRRYIIIIIWRTNHAYNERLRHIVAWANVA